MSEGTVFMTMEEKYTAACGEIAHIRALCEIAYGIWSRSQKDSETADRMADVLHEILQGSPRWPDTYCATCGHHDRYHSVDSAGTVFCRWAGECPCSGPHPTSPQSGCQAPSATEPEKG